MVFRWVVICFVLLLVMFVGCGEIYVDFGVSGLWFMLLGFVLDMLVGLRASWITPIGVCFEVAFVLGFRVYFRFCVQCGGYFRIELVGMP